MKEKIAAIMKKIFTVGTMIMIVCGSLAGVAYIIGLLIGGDAAVSIVSFTNSVLPYFFRLNILFCFAGIIHAYVTGFRGFRFEIGNKDKKKKEQ